MLSRGQCIVNRTEKESESGGQVSVSLTPIGGTSLSVVQNPSDDLACARGSRSGTSLRAARVRREESAGSAGSESRKPEARKMLELEKALVAENSRSWLGFCWESAKKFQ